MLRMKADVKHKLEIENQSKLSQSKKNYLF